MSDKKWLKCDPCKGVGRVNCKTCNGKVILASGHHIADYCGQNGCFGEGSGTQFCNICKGEGVIEGKNLNAEQLAILKSLIKDYTVATLAEESDIEVPLLEAASRGEDVGLSEYEDIKYMLNEYCQE